MLTEQRYEEILKLLEQKNTITVQELKDALNASESTIRRDLNSLHDLGKLIKVFGGAVGLESALHTRDVEVSNRKNVNSDEKMSIAKYAARLIQGDDFVYLDAGTTTGYIIDFLTEKQAVFVTNGVDHAQKLASMGYKVFLVGGELKASTQAIVGSGAVMDIQKYHFTKGFWGANGIEIKAGLTTPDPDEAMIKRISMKQTKRKYILGDHDKFGLISPVTFGDIESTYIITDKIEQPAYRKYKNIIISQEVGSDKG